MTAKEFSYFQKYYPYFLFLIFFIAFFWNEIPPIEVEYKVSLGTIIGLGTTVIIATIITESINNSLSSQRVEKDILIEEYKSIDQKLMNFKDSELFVGTNHETISQWFSLFHNQLSFIGDITPEHLSNPSLSNKEIHKLIWEFHERIEIDNNYSNQGGVIILLDKSTKIDLSNSYFEIKNKFFQMIMHVNK